MKKMSEIKREELKLNANDTEAQSWAEAVVLAWRLIEKLHELDKPSRDIPTDIYEELRGALSVLDFFSACMQFDISKHTEQKGIECP